MATPRDQSTRTKGVILSGMRPTGRLHLGNHLGALQNWVALQQEYDCIYTVVDIHALTTIESPTDVADIQPNIYEMVLDWLAAGVDPEQSTIFVQSQVPEVMTLHTLLSMVTPMGWLLRVPTFKEKIRQMDETEETVNYGLVGYPILQTADIILYKADTVPVGQDQLPHLELAREIVRRFNRSFGDTFPEPGQVDRGPADNRLRRPAEDEQVPGQSHRAGGYPGRDHQASSDRLHRPSADDPGYPWPPGGMQCIFTAQNFQLSG